MNPIEKVMKPKLLHERVFGRVEKCLKDKKDAGHKFISDQEIDDLIDKVIREELCPTRKEYDNRQVKELRFTQDFTVNSSVLYVKGDVYDTYNWNYSRLVDLFMKGILI